MRRGLWVFSAGALGIQLSYVFLPQAVFWPLAAFFVCACLALSVRRSTRSRALCVLAGTALGAVFLLRTVLGFAAVSETYAGHTLRLTACVEQVQQSYTPGWVWAQLRVEQANGERANFRIICTWMPECTPGEKIAAVFALSEPSESERLEWYTDGAVLAGKYLHSFVLCGEDESFLGRMRRLQQALSEAVRRYLDEDTGAVLAAMTVGDRSGISTELNAAYRSAGLSHILVVSGMHVSILCGGLWSTKRPFRLWRRRAAALVGSALVAVLVGVTGCTPSVLRAAVAVWLSALGPWVGGIPDPLTSLAAAGLLLSGTNSYALWDVGCQLSFVSVLGTLAGAHQAAKIKAHWYSRPKAKKKRNLLYRGLEKLTLGALEALCISAFASAATLPVLILRGLSASPYALVSGVAVVWMAQPILLFGIGAAVTGLFAPFKMVSMALSFCGGLAVYLLNGWARMVSVWPGAQIRFESEYAGYVCLALLAVGGFAAWKQVRPWAAAPVLGLVLLAATFSWGALDAVTLRAALFGSEQAPAAVLVQNGFAVLLYRGDEESLYQIQQYLDRRGEAVRLLVVDLRQDPAAEPCPLPSEGYLQAGALELRCAETLEWGEMELELLRTESGCGVLIQAAGLRLAACEGDFSLVGQAAADVLLASPDDPAAFDWQMLLSLSAEYRWIQGSVSEGLLASGQQVRLRSG